MSPYSRGAFSEVRAYSRGAYLEAKAYLRIYGITELINLCER